MINENIKRIKELGYGVTVDISKNDCSIVCVVLIKNNGMIYARHWNLEDFESDNIVKSVVISFNKLIKEL